MNNQDVIASMIEYATHSAYIGAKLNNLKERPTNQTVSASTPKFNYHSCVDCLAMANVNIYEGIAVLDQRGEALLKMPGAAEMLLNQGTGYQLVCLNQYAELVISSRLKEHNFKIPGGQPGQEIYWMVTSLQPDVPADKKGKIIVTIQPAWIDPAGKL